MVFVVFLWDDALSHRGSAAKIPWKTCKKKGSLPVKWNGCRFRSRRQPRRQEGCHRIRDLNKRSEVFIFRGSWDTPIEKMRSPTKGFIYPKFLQATAKAWRNRYGEAFIFWSINNDIAWIYPRHAVTGVNEGCFKEIPYQRCFIILVVTIVSCMRSRSYISQNVASGINWHSWQQKTSTVCWKRRYFLLKMGDIPAS